MRTNIFLKRRTSKSKETIKIRYYTLSIQKTYWKNQKRNKNKLACFQGDKGHGATSDEPKMNHPFPNGTRI